MQKVMPLRKRMAVLMQFQKEEVFFCMIGFLIRE